ncbi:MAG: winged helix-turn-helix domain-containing protein, partial [Pyrinomonadaceae bacterium]
MIELNTQIYEFGNFRLDAAKRLLLKGDDEIVPLMPKAFDTLLYLVRHSGKVIEKDELMSEIWADTIVEENNLTQNISILRRV